MDLNYERRTMKAGYYYHSYSFGIDIVAMKANAALVVDVAGGNRMSLMLVEADDWTAENKVWTPSMVGMLALMAHN